MAGVVTVVGATGHVVPVTVNGSQAYSLAQAYSNAINAAASSGSLFVSQGDGTNVPAAPGSLANEYIGTSDGSYVFPLGYDHFLAATTGHIILDASAETSSQFISTLVGTGGATYIAGDESGTFIAGGGNNLFTDGGAGAYTIATSDGNDSVFAGSGNYSIAAGTGTNLISLGAGADTVQSSGTDRIICGTGADTITLTGTGSSILGGSGAMLVNDQQATGTTIAGATGTASITGGTNSYYDLSGNSTVFSGTSDTISASGNATVYGADGTDVSQTGSASLLFVGGVGSATVNSAAGDATVFGSNGSNITYSGHGTLVAGSGNETLNGSGSTRGFAGFVSDEVAAGNNSISGGAGADTLVAGLGTQTLTGGGGDNTFIIAANGTMSSANITISDFGSSSGNLVALYGYGSSEVSDALATAQTTSGNTTITLSDTSKVTFLHVSTLNSGQFIGG